MNWTQLKTIIWLRTRLSRNQFLRGGTFNAVLKILGLIFGVILFIGSGLAGLFGGALGLSEASPLINLLAWDVIIGTFLFIWLIGVLAEIQRAESIDLARLLHLPVSLRGVFVMNYIASHTSPTLILFLPGALGICLGLVWAKGAVMLLLIPLIITFIFMITAWTYCLRGWLVTVMVNPRKRRNVMVIATMTIVLITQIPNLYFNVFLRQSYVHSNQSSRTITDTNAPAAEQVDAGIQRHLPPAYIPVHKFVPPLWLPNGAMALVGGNAWPAIWGSLGALLLGAAGLARAYQSTLRFYRGDSKAVPVKAPAAVLAPAAAGKNFLEKQVPFLPAEVAPLFLAFFRSLSRAPEVKMALVTNLVLIMVVAAGAVARVAKSMGESTRPFLGTAAVAITFFGLLQLVFNQFGYDREGFRSLVLLPASRRHVLFAKNLSFAPIIFLLGGILLVVLTIMARLSPLALAACVLQLVSMFLLISIVANFFSIFSPYRMAAGSMKAAKPPAKTVVSILVSQLFFPFLMLPIFIPPLAGMLAGDGWFTSGLVNVLASLGLLAGSILLYHFSLNGLGQYLEKREKDILLIVSHEAE